jgi:hypothetical protein
MVENIMGSQPAKGIGFDESFKILAKHFFSPFSKVITDFEILKLPKKADVLVVETEKPLKEYVKIFSYFRKFNIIEFKSIRDPFRVEEDLSKVFIYIGSLLLNENNASIENTTFTLLTSRKPDKLLKYCRKSIQKIKNGVYLLLGIGTIPVYIVLANEVEGIFDREFAFIKEFSTGTERVTFIRKVLHEVENGNHDFLNYLHFAFSLYRKDVRSILVKEGIRMTIVEKNIREWVDELGLKDEYKKEERKSIARKMLVKGFSIEDIKETTELSMEEILKLRENRE